MTNWQKIAAVAGCIVVVLAMDLLKINDQELKYAVLGILGLITGGHLATNLPSVNVGK